MECAINASLGLDGPALAPPPGVCPNLTDPYSLRTWQIVVSTLVIVLSTLILGARFVTNVLRAREWRTMLILQEGGSILAWMILTAYSVMTIELTSWGMGRHQWDTTIRNFTHALMWSNITEILYPPMICVAKLLILLQYIAIFAPQRRGFTYWGTQVLIWTNAAFYFAIFFVVIFECVPREKIWNPLAPGTCVNINATFIVTGAWNVLSDVAILVLPLHAIWLLQMRTRRKWQVSGIFSAGLFACIASILRLYYSTVFLGTDDKNFVVIQVGLWSQAEVATVIVCGALPVLPQFFKLFRTRKSPYSSNYGSYGKHSAQQPGSRTNHSAHRTSVPGPPYDPKQWHESDESVRDHGTYIALEDQRGPRAPHGRRGTENGILRTVHIESNSQIHHV